MELLTKKHYHNNPYSAQEKLKALNLLKLSSIEFVAHRYHCTIQTIYRWKRIFDGTIDSLKNGSCRPKSKHPNAHTDLEIKHILNLLKRNPNIGLNELYGKLRVNYGYSRNPVSLYRFLRKNGYFKNLLKRRKYNYKPKKYFTPLHIGEKMQLDVKVIPFECRSSSVPFDLKFYQYTIIDEATRERFIFPYMEQCADSTIDFVKRAINYFGYVPKIIQTDNGKEFTFLKENNKIHKFDSFCNQFGIIHKLIKPRTPRHNGKVERSHRNDNERFYKFLKFYSYKDLVQQMKLYLIRSNNIPSISLKWKSPIEKRKELLFIDFSVIE